jgi:hypothetical protein
MSDAAEREVAYGEPMHARFESLHFSWSAVAGVRPQYRPRKASSELMFFIRRIRAFDMEATRLNAQDAVKNRDAS